MSGINEGKKGALLRTLSNPEKSLAWTDLLLGIRMVLVGNMVSSFCLVSTT